MQSDIFWRDWLRARSIGARTLQIRRSSSSIQCFDLKNSNWSKKSGGIFDLDRIGSDLEANSFLRKSNNSSSSLDFFSARGTRRNKQTIKAVRFIWHVSATVYFNYAAIDENVGETNQTEPNRRFFHLIVWPNRSFRLKAMWDSFIIHSLMETFTLPRLQTSEAKRVPIEYKWG